LLKPPRSPSIDKPLKITGEDWHKIREQEFSDEIPDFLRRV